jgi:putative hemolysin
MPISFTGWPMRLPDRAEAALLARGGLVRRAPSRPEPTGPLGRQGALEVRLAGTAREIRRAQRLRFKVFHEEGGALPSARARLARRDVDAFDEACDHLLVLDHDAPTKPFRRPKPRVVATTRLLRRDVAARHGGFYSSGEFDLGPLLLRHPHTAFLELGRSCVLASHRGRSALSLLWGGIWAYARHHGSEVLIGCASLDGTDPDALALPLSFLHHHARSPREWAVRPRSGLGCRMDRLPVDGLDAKRALRALPPLLKGYLRLGATVGDGAVIDRSFGTTDVFVLMPVDAIGSRYVEHFAPAGRAA